MLFSRFARPLVQSSIAHIQRRLFASVIHAPSSVQPGNETLRITRAAEERIASVQKSQNKPDLALRILVEAGGCHGYQYRMAFADSVDKDEDIVLAASSGSPAVVVDSVSYDLVCGSTVDYATELIGSSFRIEENPHAKGSGCGCGVSWELKEE